MEYSMECEDGFMVKGKSKDEVANMAAMHVISMHPSEKISKKDMVKMVHPMKKMEMEEM